MTHNSTEERVALKACPFCGCANIDSSFVTGMVSEWSVWCRGCGVSVSVKCRPFDLDHQQEARQKAMRTWNTRTDNDVSGLVEALEYVRANLGDPVPIGRRHVARKVDAALAKHRQSNGGA